MNKSVFRWILKSRGGFSSFISVRGSIFQALFKNHLYVISKYVTHRSISPGTYFFCKTLVLQNLQKKNKSRDLLNDVLYVAKMNRNQFLCESSLLGVVFGLLLQLRVVFLHTFFANLFNLFAKYICDLKMHKSLFSYVLLRLWVTFSE